MRIAAGHIVAIAVTAGRLGSAHAGEVSLRVSSHETYVGLPVQVHVIFKNAREYDPPQLPQIEGARIRLTGRPSESSRVSIINGRVTREMSVTYLVEVTPTRAGTIRVPPIRARVDGKEQETASFDIVAVKSETGDLLFVELKGSRRSLYVGESLDVTLEIWIKPYADRRLRVKLSEADMWSLIDEKSQWGIFAQALQELASRRRRPVGSGTLRDDSEGKRRSYYVYKVRRTIWPERAGTLDVGDINITVSYPTTLTQDRSVWSFGDLRVANSRPIAASVRVAPVEVKPVPTEGQPPFYRGAVGRWNIQATAKPTEVRVGDPITLTMTLRGKGRLDLLQAPPLAQIPELAADFQIPDEQLAGAVENGAKRFSQSIRAKNDTAARVPPIPFAYFDPQTEKFVVVHSDPIPIKVKAAQRMAISQIVEGQTGPTVATRLTELGGGIVANYCDMDEVLADQAFAPGVVSAAVAALSPALFVICRIAQRRSERLRIDQRYARRRSARRTAMRGIAKASESRATGAAEQVARVVIGYVADRCDLPTAGLTRVEAMDALTRRNVQPDLVENTDALLRRCDDIRYAGANEDVAGDLVVQAKRRIKDLERERF